MSVSCPAYPGETEVWPGLCPGPGKGRALGTSDGCYIATLLPLPNDLGYRPEGVTRLTMRMIEGRAGRADVEPQAQETGYGRCGVDRLLTVADRANA
jgi:hypothetical protein